MNQKEWEDWNRLFGPIFGEVTLVPIAPKQPIRRKHSRLLSKEISGEILIDIFRLHDAPIDAVRLDLSKWASCT